MLNLITKQFKSFVGLVLVLIFAMSYATPIVGLSFSSVSAKLIVASIGALLALATSHALANGLYPISLPAAFIALFIFPYSPNAYLSNLYKLLLFFSGAILYLASVVILAALFAFQVAGVHISAFGIFLAPLVCALCVYLAIKFVRS